jgi:hypothetical protein
MNTPLPMLKGRSIMAIDGNFYQTENEYTSLLQRKHRQIRPRDWEEMLTLSISLIKITSKKKDRNSKFRNFEFQLNLTYFFIMVSQITSGIKYLY